MRIRYNRLQKLMIDNQMERQDLMHAAEISSSVSPVRLVDFENPKNNTYHFTAEFTCKRDQDEFRPDITLFVNGLPLVFIEVKKPNNHGGIVPVQGAFYCTTATA